MKNKKTNKILFATGLSCISAAIIMWNYKLSDAVQGFLLGLGLVLTVSGFIFMKANKQAI